jgi:hypothetical protein
MTLKWDVLVRLPAPLEAGMIRRRLPDVDWSAPDGGRFVGDGFTLEFAVEEQGRVDSFLIQARGAGDPVATIMKLCSPFGWSVMDGTTFEWLDPAQPSREGWEAWRKYRDRLAAGVLKE